MASIIYLDVDDEITSAAARIRAADADRVAVVMPHGSRVATSRINFRLLARDALTHERRLSVVAADAATRALAASAGLPVFASVSEYEGSLVGFEGTEGAGRRGAGSVGSSAAADSSAAAGGAEGDRAEPDESGAAPGEESDRNLATGRAPLVGRASAAAAAAPTAGATIGAGALGGETVRMVLPAAPRAASSDVHGPSSARFPAATTDRGAARRSLPRTALLVGVAMLALAVLVGGVGAYALLPSATVVVIPREEQIELRFDVKADPSATAPDPGGGIVPAERITLEITSSDTFDATGKRVVETKAKGTVTFQSFDPGGANTIQARSIIATEGRIQFRTTRSITLPAAQIVPEGAGAVIIPTRANVPVEAVKDGEAGNVPSNAITLVPRGENPTLTKVRNADPTEGGSREQFPRILQADIDAALTTLQAVLTEAFARRMEDPSIAPVGATVFPATGALGAVTPTRDPATLLDQEVATFELGLNATGTVLSADPGPVTAIAEERLRSNVGTGREFVEGSSRIEVGEGNVIGGHVSFAVTASAAQVGSLDPAELEALILGKPVEDARQLLASFGEVELTVWPDWVTTVPTLDARVDVQTERRIEVTSTTPSPAP